MPLVRLQWTPGVNTMETQTRNKSGWSACNLIRWRNGLLEKVAGWLRLFNSPCAGIVRALHAYLDLLNEKNLLIAGDAGLQMYVVTSGQASNAGTLYTIGFAGASVTTQVTMTPTNGSTIISIAIDNHGASVGGTVTFHATFSVGGRVVYAPYSATIITVPNNNNFTFNMPLAATNSTPDTTPFATFTLSNEIAIGVATLTNHGLPAPLFLGATNSQFPLNMYTAIGTSQFPGIVVPAGNSLLVYDIIDADSFHFFLSPYNPTSAGTYGNKANPTITGFDGTNLAQQQPLITILSNGPTTIPNNWFLENLGTNGLVSYTNGPIYVFVPPASSSPVVSNIGNVTTPQINTGFFVAMPQAQIIAFGSEVTLGTGVQDPLLLRWSDAGGYTEWTADSDNQAGSYRLGGNGTRIVGGIQAPQTTLIFTDVDVWSMQYVGPPLIYSFATIGTGCGLVGPKAMAILGRACLWMSFRGLFSFSDSGIVPVSCPIWDVIFNDIDPNYLYKVFLGANSAAHEIWIFYPSISGGLGECDKYAKVNIVENLWDYGSLRRSAWLKDNDFGTALGADSNYRIQQHEIGYDNDNAAMANVFAESGYADMADGDAIMHLSEYEPDMKWSGSNGAATVTFHSTNYAGAAATTKGPFALDSENRFIRPRVRGRQIAIRIDWVERRGFSARLGTPRARLSPAGRRP